MLRSINRGNIGRILLQLRMDLASNRPNITVIPQMVTVTFAMRQELAQPFF